MTVIDVLIAGAGPAGLTLGIELTRRGKSVRIIDKAAEPFHGSRGKGIQPRTLEVFDDLGVLERLNAMGGDYQPIRIQLGRVPIWQVRIAKIREPTPAVPYPNLLMVPQNLTDTVLSDRLAELGVQVERGTSLIGFEQDDGGVTARVDTADGPASVRARYLVGADGGHSAVRRALGVTFAGETRQEERLVIADVRLTGLDRNVWRAYVSVLRMRFRLSLVPLPGTDLYQLIMPLRPGEEPPALTLDGLRARIRQAGLRWIHLTEVKWASVWRANVRMAERFRVGRVFLAGDAAHVHSPAGGQGLNTGVQDAYNLGWKLSAVLGGVDASLLDTYEEERMPVAAAVLGLSTRLHEDAKGSMAKAFRRGAETDQLGIHYRGRSLSVDEGAGPGAGAGDRAADGAVRTAGGEARLFDLFRGPHWTLITCGAAAPADLPEDVHAYSVASSPWPVRFTLVRPDGYVGLLTDDPDSVATYLSRVTARPAGGRMRAHAATDANGSVK